MRGRDRARPRLLESDWGGLSEAASVSPPGDLTSFLDPDEAHTPVFIHVSEKTVDRTAIPW